MVPLYKGHLVGELEEAAAREAHACAVNPRSCLSDIHLAGRLPQPNPRMCAQVCAITPFQVVSALVFGFTVYGMAGLRPGAAAVLKNGAVGTLMYLIASQVCGRLKGREG